MQELLFDSQFLARLEQLELLSRRTFVGRTAGQRRSQKRGHGVEFVDYRNYVKGDDLRYIDWNIYGRLEKLFLKISLQEEDLHLHLLIDGSRSMAFGKPDKLLHAKRIAAALAYIALGGLDRVQITFFRDGLAEKLPACRGKGSIFKIFDFLNRVEPSGGTGLLESLKRYRLAGPQPGILVLLSDFLDPEGFEQPLRQMLSRKYQLCLVQTLAREEIEPDLVGDLRLIDAETGAAREVSLSPRILKQYRQTAEFYCNSLRSFALERDALYLRTFSDEPFEDFILRSLRKQALLG
jgi:uncharacterized protein (DUF58 family)